MTRKAEADAPALLGRLAPSPTGYLHLGHARTFLVAWWHARSRGGRVLLRIEDLDADRSRPELADALREDLAWLGLDWDGEPSVQSAHLERFDDAVQKLLESGMAYPCICTRADLRTLAQAPHEGEVEPRYPGTCRDRFASIEEAERQAGRPVAVRLRVPPGPVTIEDGSYGPFTTDVASEVGDFLVQRRGGAPAYQLAVAVDDAAEGVSEVVRGRDLLPSAVRQWHVQNALSLPHPSWVHVPLVLDATGRRLAKHEHDLALRELRGRGVDARRIVAWAARSVGIETKEPVSARDLVASFRLDRLPHAAVRLEATTGFLV